MHNRQRELESGLLLNLSTSVKISGLNNHNCNGRFKLLSTYFLPHSKLKQFLAPIAAKSSVKSKLYQHQTVGGRGKGLLRFVDVDRADKGH